LNEVKSVRLMLVGWSVRKVLNVWMMSIVLHYSIFRIILSYNRWIYLFNAAHSRVSTRKTFVANPLVQRHICFLRWTIFWITTCITLSDRPHNILAEWGLVVRNLNLEVFLVLAVSYLADLLDVLFESLSFFLFSILLQ
jgi:hypothetical protein